MPPAPPAPSDPIAHRGTNSWNCGRSALAEGTASRKSPHGDGPSQPWHVLCVFPLLKHQYRPASLGYRVGDHHVRDAVATQCQRGTRKKREIVARKRASLPKLDRALSGLVLGTGREPALHLFLQHGLREVGMQRDPHNRQDTLGNSRYRPAIKRLARTPHDTRRATTFSR